MERDCRPPKTKQAGTNSGYSVRSGKWKGVVPHCGKNLKPSATDDFQIYDLEADRAEAHDLAATDVGKKQAATFAQLLAQEELSCKCFQCGQ